MLSDWSGESVPHPTVRAIAEAGSISGAAERLGVAQSAVSTRLASIEASVGTPLFERLPRGVTPTSAGSRLIPYTRRIAELVVEARAAAIGSLEVARQPFELGATEIASATVLPRALASVMSSEAPPEIHLRTATTAGLLAAVDEGTLDAAIVSANGQLGDRPQTVLGALSLALAWPVGTEPGRVRHAFGFGDGCVCTSRLRAIDAAHEWGLEFTRLGSVDAIVGCVAAGLGVTLLPRALLRSAEVETSSVPALRLVLVYRIERQLEAMTIARSLRAVVS